MTLLLTLFIFYAYAANIASICTNRTIQDFGTSSCDTGAAADCGVTSVGGVYCFAPVRYRQVAGSTKNHTSCTSQTGVNCSGCGTAFACNGNWPYCSTTTCDYNSPCYCQLDYYDSVRESYIGGQWVTTTPTSVTFKGVPPTYVMPPSNPAPFGFQMGGYSKRHWGRQSNTTNSTSTTSSPTTTTAAATTLPAPRSGLTQASFDQPTLNVATPYPSFTRIAITKDGMQSLFGCAGALCSNEVDSGYFINPGVLNVAIYINDTLDTVANFDVASYITCDVPRCILCPMMYHNFACFPWQFQVFLISLTVAAVLGSIVFLIGILRGMCMFACCRKCGKVTKNKIEIGWEKIAKKIRKRGDQQGTQTDNEEVPLGLIRENPRNREYMVSPLLVILLFLPLVLASNCAQGVTIPVANTACTANGSIETCTFTFDTLVTIPAPGLSACLTFAKAGNIPIGRLDITYTAMVQVAPLQSLYYTCAWGGTSYSLKHCPWETMCGSCANYNPVTNPCACDGNGNCIFNGVYCAYPGLSRCDSQCGCAGCGCFACDASCVYSRAEIVPRCYDGGTPGPCQVFRPISVILQPQISTNFSYSYVLPGGPLVQTNELHNISVVGLTTQIGYNFTATIQGTLSGSTTQFAGEKVIGCTSGWRMGAAADPNQPVAHGIGDIQANSISDFNYGGAFQFATGLFTPLLTSSATNYVFEGSGINAVFSADTLPTQRGSVLWTVSGSNLVGLDQAPGAVVMTVSSPNAITVSRTVNVVCPKITSANITGCFSCNQGATITVLARSQCSAGQALVIATGSYTVSTPSVVLQTTDSVITLRVTAGTANVIGDIKLVNGDYSDTITVQGVLVPDPLIVLSNQTFTNTSATAQAMLDFGSWFNGLADWMKGLLLTGMIIAGIAAGIVILVVIIKVVKAVKQSNLEAKYERLTQQQQEAAIRKMQLSQLKTTDFDFDK